MPSLFEPCGLTQLIALRYGAIPVVRKTGGLEDTVTDIDFGGKPFEESNGFSFDHANSEGLDSALDRALVLWKKNPNRWQTLVEQALTSDFSWQIPAKKYCSIYEKIVTLEPCVSH